MPMCSAVASCRVWGLWAHRVRKHKGAPRHTQHTSVCSELPVHSTCAPIVRWRGVPRELVQRRTGGKAGGSFVKRLDAKYIRTAAFFATRNCVGQFSSVQRDQEIVFFRQEFVPQRTQTVRDGTHRKTSLQPPHKDAQILDDKSVCAACHQRRLGRNRNA